MRPRCRALSRLNVNTIGGQLDIELSKIFSNYEKPRPRATGPFGRGSIGEILATFREKKMDRKFILTSKCPPISKMIKLTKRNNNNSSLKKNCDQTRKKKKLLVPRSYGRDAYFFYSLSLSLYLSFFIYLFNSLQSVSRVFKVAVMHEANSL